MNCIKKMACWQQYSVTGFQVRTMVEAMNFWDLPSLLKSQLYSASRERIVVPVIAVNQ